jgi:formamidopyrimidine-DNA glycosylase
MIPVARRPVPPGDDPPIDLFRPRIVPELPEIERLRLDLAEALPGSRVRGVDVRRGDVVRPAPAPDALLAGDRIDRLTRHGKQLAIVGRSGRVVCVHLGMSGRLLAGARASVDTEAPHTHVVWDLAGGRRMAFNDPRRFGGLWTFASEADLMERRWRLLGPDALTIRAPELRPRLARTCRAVKAALLDQALLAGVGNIYADESLFRARVHPETPAGELDPPRVRTLAGSIRAILRRAVEAGGSTLRDYRRADGAIGGFQARHRVYGRAGLPCVRCGRTLESTPVAQRTTVWCPACQPPLSQDHSMKKVNGREGCRDVDGAATPARIGGVRREAASTRA